jgi:hypothetical protein
MGIPERDPSRADAPRELYPPGIIGEQRIRPICLLLGIISPGIVAPWSVVIGIGIEKGPGPEKDLGE